MTSSDKDQGESVVVGPFIVTNLAGDYKRNLVIDGDDLLEFSDAWYAQDTTKEIGPVTGTPPNMKINTDGVIDFEDLSVFAWMWQWYTENGARKSALISAALKPDIENTDTGDMLSFVSTGDGIVRLESREVLDFIDVFVETDGDPSMITFKGAEYWGTGIGGIALGRTYGDGVIELAAVRFDSYPSREETLPFTLAEIGIIDEKSVDGITIYYKARIKGEEELVTGVLEITQELLSSTPKEYVLYQNTPNPFNPTTTITYTLPVDTNVKLAIYNISGQQVTQLKNTFDTAGAYSVIWDALYMPSGIYFYTLKTDKFAKTIKMLLLK